MSMDTKSEPKRNTLHKIVATKLYADTLKHRQLSSKVWKSKEECKFEKGESDE